MHFVLVRCNKNPLATQQKNLKMHLGDFGVEMRHRTSKLVHTNKQSANLGQTDYYAYEVSTMHSASVSS